MRDGWVWCARRVVRHNVKLPRRLLSTQAQPQADALSRATRNIGIIAHIDAVRTLKGNLEYNVLTRLRAKQLPQSACSIIVGIPEELEVCKLSMKPNQTFAAKKLLFSKKNIKTLQDCFYVPSESRISLLVFLSCLPFHSYIHATSCCQPYIPLNSCASSVCTQSDMRQMSTKVRL
jgi:hypothetical protein